MTLPVFRSAGVSTVCVHRLVEEGRLDLVSIPVEQATIRTGQLQLQAQVIQLHQDLRILDQQQRDSQQQVDQHWTSFQQAFDAMHRLFDQKIEQQKRHRNDAALITKRRSDEADE